ncbi:MAG: ABC transporter ATP-binding protein [Pigmentiphaga sp.]|nr:ABC transporter ATP-binding protein [Pigmentiphaga sp.]
MTTRPSAGLAPVLQTRHLTKRFGGIVATNDVSLSVLSGARHALIGPNGAGKTTLVNQLTGVLSPTSGQIELEGADITRLPAHQRARRGLMRTFQINQLFNTLTPLETIVLVISQRDGRGGGWWRALDRDTGRRDEAAELLHGLHLGDVMSHDTAVLPYGKRRLLEIAVALAGKPRVLLLDEPMAGVPVGQSREILDTLAALPADVTVLLIEHDMDLVFRFATRMSVLVNGAIFAEGEPDEIASDERVKNVYLGRNHG